MVFGVQTVRRKKETTEKCAIEWTGPHEGPGGPGKDKARLPESQTSDDLFNAIFDSVNDAILFHDPETGAILNVNQGMCGMFGYTRNEAFNLSPAALITVATVPEKQNIVDLLRKTKDAAFQSFKGHGRHKNGRSFPVEVHVRRARLGGEDRALVTVRDVGALERAEETLRRSENRYRGLFEVLPDGFASVEMDGRIIETNPALQKMTGYTGEELLGISYHEITPAKWRPLEARIISEQARVRGYSDIYEKEFIRKDGTLFPAETRVSFFRDEEGNPMEMRLFIKDISARKEAERTLQESEAKFRLLFEKSGDPILLLDENTFVDCNEAAVKLMNCSDKRGIIGLRPSHISPERQPDGRLSSEEEERHVKVALENGVNHFEWVHRTLGGEEFWVDVSLTKIPIRGKQIMYTVWRDIRERKRAEESLRQAEQKYRTIYENSVEGIFQTLPEGRYLSANTSLARILGYESPEEMIDLITDIGIEQYVNPEDRKRLLALFDTRNFDEGFDTEFYNKRGARVWISINGRAIKDTDGKTLYYEGTVHDITDRKRAEDQLHKERETFYSILHNAPYGIFLHDPSGRCLFLNSEALSITGYEMEDIPTGREWFLKAYPDSWYRQGIIDVWKKDVSKRSIDRAYTVRCKDGSEKELEFRTFTLSDGKSVTMFRDMTERIRANEELRKSREELRTLAAHMQSVREEERTRIAREIHDELGQALTCVKIDLSEIREEFDPAPPNRDRVLSKTESLLELVDGTIDIVRRIAAELRPSILDDLGLPAAVQWLLQDFRNRTGIKCELKAPGATRIGEDIATAAFRIIQESLTNVARHSGADKVRITLAEKKGSLILSVKDNGKGIKEREAASPTSFGILGMRERVSLLGGTTVITGRPGKGTTITMEIPLTGDNKQGKE